MHRTTMAVGPTRITAELATRYNRQRSGTHQQWLPSYRSAKTSWAGFRLGQGDAYAPRFTQRLAALLPEPNEQLTATDCKSLCARCGYVLPVDDFARGLIGAEQESRSKSAGPREPDTDPLTFTPLRNAVIHSAWGRGKKDLPPGIAKDCAIPRLSPVWSQSHHRSGEILTASFGRNRVREIQGSEVQS